MATNHRAGGEVEPHAARMGELLQCRHRQQGVPGDRQLHRGAVAPVVALQAQGQATQGRDLSTLAPLRVLRTRTPAGMNVKAGLIAGFIATVALSILMIAKSSIGLMP